MTEMLSIANEDLGECARLKRFTNKTDRQAQRDLERRERQYQQIARQRERQIEKSRSPEAIVKKKECQAKWNAFQYKTQKKALVRDTNDGLLNNNASDKVTSKIKSRGLKGRPPTVEEQKIMDAFAKLGCIACLMKGRIRPLVSMHHSDGRTKPFAHGKALPLCENHHDTPASKDTISLYPDLIPIHAKGKVGGKGEWYKQNGTERELLKRCYELAGIKPVFEL